MARHIRGTAAMTLHVHDLDRAAAFWRALGLEGDAEPGGEAVSFAIPGSGPLTLHRWQSQCAENGGRPPGTVSGLMFDTADVEAACREVGRSGGRVVDAPFPGPDGGRWAVAADPDGNEFFLCGP